MALLLLTNFVPEVDIFFLGVGAPGSTAVICNMRPCSHRMRQTQRATQGAAQSNPCLTKLKTCSVLLKEAQEQEKKKSGQMVFSFQSYQDRILGFWVTPYPPPRSHQLCFFEWLQRNVEKKGVCGGHGALVSWIHL